MDVVSEWRQIVPPNPLTAAKFALDHYGKYEELFTRLFRDFWQELRKELNKFRQEIKEQQGTDDVESKRVVGNILSECRESVTISDNQEVLEQGKLLNSNYTAYYNQLLWKTRTALSVNFLKLDG
ncbi:MAG: hypothetical protein AAGD25_38070 [Cyanobacteria bacterium P01_F01_bin.150]